MIGGNDAVQVDLDFACEGLGAAVTQFGGWLRIMVADSTLVFGRFSSPMDVMFYTTVCSSNSVYPLLTRVDNGDCIVGYYLYADPDDMDGLAEDIERLAEIAQEVHIELTERCAVAGRVN